MTDEVIISLKDVEKWYRGRRVLAISELFFGRFEGAILVGSNGSGKSTLLRVLAGVSRVDSGTIISSAAYEGACIGFLPQMGGYYIELTVLENFRMRRRLFGRSTQDAAVDKYLHAFELTSVVDRRVSDLSGGYQRMVAIALVFAVEPSILLLDEPLNGLDGDRGSTVLSAISKLHSNLDLLVVASPKVTGEWNLSRTISVQQGSIV